SKTVSKTGSTSDSTTVPITGDTTGSKTESTVSTNGSDETTDPDRMEVTEDKIPCSALHSLAKEKVNRMAAIPSNQPCLCMSSPPFIKRKRITYDPLPIVITLLT